MTARQGDFANKDKKKPADHLHPPFDGYDMVGGPP
jgi:hypothetical protein